VIAELAIGILMDTGKNGIKDLRNGLGFASAAPMWIIASFLCPSES
jgi:hypothetical protein